LPRPNRRAGKQDLFLTLSACRSQPAMAASAGLRQIVDSGALSGKRSSYGERFSISRQPLRFCGIVAIRFGFRFVSAGGEWRQVR